LQAEQCLYVVLERQKTTIVLIADSKARRDAWLQALRQLHGFRIYDVRYAYPWQPPPAAASLSSLNKKRNRNNVKLKKQIIDASRFVSVKF